MLCGEGLGPAKTGAVFYVCCMGRLGTVPGLFGEEKCGLGMVGIPYIDKFDDIQDFIRFYMFHGSISHISSIKSVIFNLH